MNTLSEQRVGEVVADLYPRHHEIPPYRMDEETWRAHVLSKIDEADRLIQALRRSVEDTATSTQRIESNTAQVVSAFSAAAGAIKTLEAIGKLAKPLVFISAVLTTISVGWLEFKRRLM